MLKDRLAAVLRDLLPPLRDRRQLLWILLPIGLGYGAEVAQFTFAYDYYHNQIVFTPSHATGYAADGRYLGELLNILTFHSATPSLYLVLALTLLILASLIFVDIFRPLADAANGGPLVLVVPVIVLYPFFFDILSFVSTRIVVASGYLFAVLAGSIALRYRNFLGYLFGSLCLVCSLLLYQAAFNVALLFVVFSAIRTLLDTNDLKASLRARVLPGLVLTSTALVAYLTLLKVWPVAHTRLDTLFRFPSNAAELMLSVRTYLSATTELLVKEQSIFPFASKIALGFIALALLFGAVRSIIENRLSLRNGFVLALFLLSALVSSYGICLPFYPPAAFLQYRICASFAFFTGGLLGCALALNRGFGRRVVGVCAVVVIYVFIFNINIAHQYLLLLNEADKATSLLITSRLKGDPAYRPGLPLVVVGQLSQDVAFPIAKTFGSIKSKQIWGYTAVNSVFATSWSRERVLMAFLPFTHPGEREKRIAEAYAARAGNWPAPDSATIVDGVMVVVLERDSGKR